MNLAFVIHPDDNVATAIADLEAGPVTLRGETSVEKVSVPKPVKATHKIALTAIDAGEAVIKYGCVIGTATADIAPGDWVHLHNVESNYDARSGSLDPESGSPTDMEDAYR